MDDVTEAYRGTKNADDPSRREKYFLLVSKYVDQNGDVINVPVYINEKGSYNRVFIDTNKVATVYGKIEFRKYIQTPISKGNLVRMKKEATKPVNRHRQLMPIMERVLPMVVYATLIRMSTKILKVQKKDLLSSRSARMLQIGLCWQICLSRW